MYIKISSENLSFVINNYFPIVFNSFYRIRKGNQKIKNDYHGLMVQKKTKKREHRRNARNSLSSCPDISIDFCFSNFYHHIELPIHSIYTYHIIKHAYTFPYHLLSLFFFYFVNQCRNKIIIDEVDRDGVSTNME